MKKITIAIDGFSSTGKSTIAKALAKKLSYVYVDTGAMYRAVTLYALNHGYIEEHTKQIKDLTGFVQALETISLDFRYDPTLGYAPIFLNGVNVEKQIRSMQVSRLVSSVAAISQVRKILVAQQQHMGKDKGLVMDGRDIGTVVFPDAELKLFLTASAQKRAYRRYKELLDRGDKVTYQEVLNNVEQRDYLDANRKESPLIKHKDAVEIDNSDMGLEEQFERIYHHVKRILQA